MIKPKVGIYAVYEPSEEGWQDWEAQLDEVADMLISAGAEVLKAPEAVYDDASCSSVGGWFKRQYIDVLYVLVVCWSFDHYTIRIQQAVNAPVIIRSISGIRTGSIVGGQQLNCILTDIDIEHMYYYSELGNEQVTRDAVVYATGCAMRNRLRGTRIGVVGSRTQGMTPTAVDEVEILRLFGVQLIHFGFDELLANANNISQNAAEEAWREVSTAAKEVSSGHEAGLAAMKNYLAAKQLVQTLDLHALSIGAYPHCQGTMCLPIALLNDEGIIAGCEGDVNSTLSMVLLSLLSDAPVHFGEMLEIDEAANTVVTSHCGAGAPSLANSSGFVLCPVRLANDGVCIRYSAKTGPVTYVNLVGRKENYRLGAFEGEAVTTGMVFEGNPLKIHMKTSFHTIIKLVAENGFGHHWMTGYGHYSEILQAFCRLVGMIGVFPDLS